MMARGKHREKLVEAGLQLFSQEGFAATGVQEITDLAGVPKGSFYNYFDSKVSFAVEVVDHYREQACRELEAMLFSGNASPLCRLRGLIEHFGNRLVGSDFAGGCLAGRLAQEMAGENPAMRVPLGNAFECMRSAIARNLAEAVQAGELAPGTDTAMLAEFIVSGTQGAMLRAKAAGSDEPLRNLVEVLFKHVLARPAFPQ